MSRRVKDLDPAPREWKLVDIGELWRLGSLLVDEGVAEEREIPHTRYEVERIERVQTVTRRLGLRTWTETRRSVIYRSIPTGVIRRG